MNRYLLLAVVVTLPLAVLSDFFRLNALFVFAVSAAAIIPMAKLIGDSTEALAHYYSTGVSALLNSTFGNMVEVILAVFAIRAGLMDLVKASITGSILGNILLIGGLSLLAGGLRFRDLSFRKNIISVQTSMLSIAVVGLVTPTVFSVTTGRSPTLLSDFVALLMVLTYFAGLLFTFRTHRHIITPAVEEVEASSPFGWSKRKSLAILGGSAVAAALLSEILIRSVEEAGQSLHLSELFVGAVVVAVVGNAAEHSSAITMARKGKMNLSLEITSASSIQIALFVVPVLVFSGLLLNSPVTLAFTEFEVITIFLAVILAHFVSHDGEGNWLEGVQLVSVYLIIAATFFFL